MIATLEHTNITVKDPHATARWMHQVFGWRTRWQGPAIDGGQSVHVGTEGQYLALYAPDTPELTETDSYKTLGGLNHVGVTVPDLPAARARVIAAGFTPEKFADYEPGARFYFRDENGVEYEVVSYAA
ncbi:VOC family protein [Thalassobius sp. S69A]|uniref:VOC family protein n=1 Tax=unclassified Thalassovita TaxID=2619711 RepID=UPI000C0E1CC4|nr:glyoxalase [Paracoccaceae bacterium]MBT25109.1 glyoxalase [Paracoccaceae bacterium]